MKDLDIVEANEAFAAQALAVNQARGTELGRGGERNFAKEWSGNGFWKRISPAEEDSWFNFTVILCLCYVCRRRFAVGISLETVLSDRIRQNP